MDYQVKEQIGVNCITFEDGQKVYEAIYPELRARNPVVLNFVNVKIVASPFLNAAIGQLLRDLAPQDLNEYLKFKNLPALTGSILRRVIENAKAYYEDDTVREAVDSVLAKVANDADAA